MMKNLLSALAVMTLHLVAAGQTDNTCSLIPNSKKCVDSTPCKAIGDGLACLAGVKLPSGAARLDQSCWQYTYDFACATASINTCTDYEKNDACAVVESKCVDFIPETGKCSEYKNTYSCQTKGPIKEQRLSCSSGVFNDSMMPTPANQNGTFVKAALAQEVLRQSATYGKNGENIFSGVLERCSKGYYGIKNCCKAAPGAKSNSEMATLAMRGGISAVKYAGEAAVDMASPYVYDAMFAGGEFTAGLAWDMSLSSANTVYDFSSNSPVGTDFAASGPSIGAYGFTFQSGTAAAGSGLMGANTTLTTFGGSNFSITFNPYVFAAMVVIKIIQDLAACSNDEQLLAMHKGANLSVYTQIECVKKWAGSCVEWEERYCSFNSVLAKIINTQGKPQLNQPVADCKGLSVTDISKIDFTKIDFSEFSGSMTQQALKNTPTNVQGNYTPIIQSKPSGSDQGTNLVIPTYRK